MPDETNDAPSAANGVEPNEHPRGWNRPVGISQVDSDIRALHDMHRRQVRLYRNEQRVIEQALVRKRRPLTDVEIQTMRAGIAQLLDENLRDRLEAIDVFLTRITRGSLDITKAREALMGSSDDAQLQAQIRREFLRSAYTFTTADWKMLDDVRELQRKHRLREAHMRCNVPRAYRPGADDDNQQGSDDDGTDDALV